jgi:TonB-linked SusC/RagA family outer membrane protein
MNGKNIIKTILPVVALIIGSMDTIARTDSIPVSPGLFPTQEKNNTAAVSSVSGEFLYKTNATNLTNTFQGAFPGMTALQGNISQSDNNLPFSDNAGYFIRSIGSYGYGGYNVARLFVDGFEVNQAYVASLSPSEIETVSILKDGAALTVFGERGANGIIWIETKRSKTETPEVKVQLRSGLQAPTAINKPLSAYEYAALYNQAYSNDRGGKTWTPYYTGKQLDAYRNGTGTDVDWYDEVMRDNGWSTDADISFSGGSNTTKYNVVLGYVNQQGLFDVENDRDKTSNLAYTKYSLRTNLDFVLFDFFEAKVDFGARLQDYKKPNYSIDGLMYNTANYPFNVYNVFDDTEQTRYSGTAIYPDNPVASIKSLGWNLYNTRNLQGNFSLKERLDMIAPGLYARQSFSFNSYTVGRHNKTKDYARWNSGMPTTTNQETTIGASGYAPVGMEDWKQGNITAGYSRTFDVHAVAADVNFNISAFSGNSYFNYKNHHINYSGRVNYTYDDKYTGAFSFSYFGNDTYAPENRWSFYPSVSAGWIVSNEGFINTDSYLNFLKLRASFGMSGSSVSNQTSSISSFNSGGRLLYKDYYTTNSPYTFYTGAVDAIWQTTLRPMFIANPDVHAEKSSKYNLGIDGKFIRNRLSLTADAYLDKRTDILTYEESLMQYYGVNYLIRNVGEMTNYGFELMSVYSDKTGDWEYSLTGILSYGSNRIDDMKEVPPANSFSASTGHPYGTIIGLVSEGFYSKGDFNDDGKLKESLPTPSFGAVQPGDIKYKDLDNNKIIDQNDVEVIGKSPYPKWSGSIGGNVRYKGFDLNIMLTGAWGASINMLDAFGSIATPFQNNGNVYRLAKGAWVDYDGLSITDNAVFPRLTTQQNDNNYRTSSFWIKDFSFLRVKNLEFGYSINLNSWRIKQFRVYVNASNPFVFSRILNDYDMDPEMTGTGYPLLKTYSAGISLTF